MRFGDKMCKTYLEEFKQEMGPAKEIYTAEIEKVLKDYPLQWFNYFDIWEDE